jgi:hypothetical protein
VQNGRQAKRGFESCSAVEVFAVERSWAHFKGPVWSAQQALGYGLLNGWSSPGRGAWICRVSNPKGWANAACRAVTDQEDFLGLVVLALMFEFADVNRK